MQVGIKFASPGDRFRAEIDADAVGRLKRGQQIAAAAAELQHSLARRDQKSHELAVVLAIGGVEVVPVVALIQCRLDVFPEFILPQIAVLRLGSGLCRIHRNPRMDMAQAPTGAGGYQPRIRIKTVCNSISLSPSLNATGFGPSGTTFVAAFILSTVEK